MAVQLLTKGKVRLQYRASEERLQLVKQSARLNRHEAIALVEKYVSSKSPRISHANSDDPTRAMIIEANVQAALNASV
jgi:septum formation topological specificity factor MinE